MRKGRWSTPEARYFVTCCVVRPSSALMHGDCPQDLRRTISRLHEDGDIALHCAGVMPDHVHILFTLGARLSLGRVVSKLKGLTAETVRLAGAAWQANFFEHRLRPEEERDPYARYIFMNPYRAGLLRRQEKWPGWFHTAENPPAFVSMLEEGIYPPAAWLDEMPEEMGLDAAVLGEV